MAAGSQGRLGGPQAPPSPTLTELLLRLGVANAPFHEQRKAAALAAYGGALRPAELATMRQAGLIPYNYEAAEKARASDT